MNDQARQVTHDSQVCPDCGHARWDCGCDGIEAQGKPTKLHDKPVNFTVQNEFKERVQPEPVSPTSQVLLNCDYSNTKTVPNVEPASPQEDCTVNQSTLACNSSLDTDVRTTSPSTNVSLEEEVFNEEEDRYALEQVVGFITDSVEICKKHDRPDGQLGFVRVLQMLLRGKLASSGESLEQEAREWCERRGSQFLDDTPRAIVAFVRDREKRA